jgi:two-component system, sensor histidine kinase SagS
MASQRPKLRITPPQGTDTSELMRLLGDHYDVEFVPTDDPRQTDAGPPQTTPPSASSNGSSPFTAQLVESVGLGLAIMTGQGRIVHCNPYFDNLDPDVAARLNSVCRDAVAYFDAAAASSRTELIRRFEISSGDHPRWYEVRVWPMDPGPDHQTRLALSVHDVTRAGLAEQKIAAIELAGRELVRLEADAIRKMNMIERLTLLENKIIRCAHELLNFDHFAVRLIDQKTGKLELVISCGLSPEAREFDLYPKADGNGLAGRVAATGRSIRCGDTSKEDRFLPALNGSQSALVVPLRLHDKVIGVLDVESLEPHTFTSDDQRFAEMFSGYIALALHMLDLLVVERTATNETVSGRVAGELTEPLDDILKEAEGLDGAAAKDPAFAKHLAQIKSDVNAIKTRVRDVAAGPQTLLGVERALRERKADPALVGKRILVADDTAKVRRIITDVLRNRGATVVSCRDGKHAIESLESAAAEGKPFDLVISDIKMPDRNGYEVFTTARHLDANLPVILMTGFGYDPNHSIVRASQEGLQSVLFKPIQVERLIDEVKSALLEESSTSN